jgi:drug/metabolite transporter (DMT)-like permease
VPGGRSNARASRRAEEETPVGAATVILASVLLGVAGQLVLKVGVGRIGPLALGAGPAGGAVEAAWRIGRSPYIWGGLAVYGVSLLLWLLGLSQVELSFAYPFISLSYVLILLTSWVLFRERVSWWRLLGVAAICAGVCAVAAG